jgi:CRP/FNR family transcriptional regulator
MSGGKTDRGPLLRVLDERDPKLVADNSRVRRMGKREYVFMEGQEPQRYAVVLHGRVKLVTTTEEGRETILDFVEPGEIICPHATISNAPYCCSAVTDDDHTDVLMLNSRVVDEAVVKGMPVVGTLVREMAKRGSTMCKRVSEVASGRVEQRLIRILLRLTDSRGDVEMAGTQDRSEILFTRQDLAELCGTSPETVTRLLRKMEERKWVELGRGRVRVLQRDALADSL